MEDSMHRVFSFLRLTSYRMRTAIYLLAVVFSVGIVIGFTLRFGVQFALLREIDILLREDADELTEVLLARKFSIDETLAKQWNRRAAVHELHHWFIRIADAERQTVWESVSVPLVELPLNLQQDENPFSWDEYRIVQRTIQEPGSDRSFALQVGTGLDTIHNDLWLLDRLLAISVMVLSILGPLSAWYLSGKLLEPLGQLTDAAEKVESTVTGTLLPLRGANDELDRLAETINHLLMRVRDELQRREDWLANSAHQLRSPLAAISGSVEVVANRLEEGASQNMLWSVLEECSALRTLVNKLLLLSEADSDRLKQNHKPINLVPLVKQACEIFEGLAVARGVELTFALVDDFWIKGNSHYMRHVVQNLIDNAIKFTSSGGHVRVLLERDPSWKIGRLIVEDSGIGISEKDLPKVTERFYRADSGRNPALTPRGSGLGLSICQSIVQGHDGVIEITSRVGKGTRVSVKFPLVAENSV